MIYERLTQSHTLARGVLAFAIGSSAMLATSSSETAHAATKAAAVAAGASIQVNAFRVPGVETLQAVKQATPAEISQDWTHMAATPASSQPTSRPITGVAVGAAESVGSTVAIQPAPIERYFFGSGEAAIKFAKLGAHAHYIAQLEYQVGIKDKQSESDIGCLQNLTVMESSNEETAKNSQTGAYGLGQALPKSKMIIAGPDYLTNPATQVAWIEDYVNEPQRYGSACVAWAHWEHNRSY